MANANRNHFCAESQQHSRLKSDMGEMTRHEPLNIPDQASGTPKPPPAPHPKAVPLLVRSEEAQNLETQSFQVAFFIVIPLSCWGYV